jgi:hypothetical protein
MPTRSEAELAGAAAEALRSYTQVDTEYREQRFLTDDELRASMVEQVSAEKASIRQAIDAGRIYVAAGAEGRRVHLYNCSSLREQVDRDRAWAIWLHGDLEEFRRQLAYGDGSPRMLRLLDRAGIEALPAYVTCRICSPTLDHPRKTRGERTTKLTSLTARHIGRVLTALDGSPLGQLQRIITTVDAAGSTLRIETTTHSLAEADQSAVLVEPGAS